MAGALRIGGRIGRISEDWLEDWQEDWHEDWQEHRGLAGGLAGSLRIGRSTEVWQED